MPTGHLIRIMSKKTAFTFISEVKIKLQSVLILTEVFKVFILRWKFK